MRNMKTKMLASELLHKMDTYWRAANYLLVGQIYLYDNPLLKQPLKLSHVKLRSPSQYECWRPFRSR
jgi:xylulose-5-phosphate/fructose-6-phosphate phosphoketolase